jgi:hypothetical protein
MLGRPSWQMPSATASTSSSSRSAGTTPRDEPGALGLGGVHHARRSSTMSMALALAHRARQALRAAGAGDDADLDLAAGRTSRCPRR